LLHLISSITIAIHKFSTTQQTIAVYTLTITQQIVAIYTLPTTQQTGINFWIEIREPFES